MHASTPARTHAYTHTPPPGGPDRVARCGGVSVRQGAVLQVSRNAAKNALAIAFCILFFFVVFFVCFIILKSNGPLACRKACDVVA